MEFTITKGECIHLDACYEILMNSEIGMMYFLSFNPQNILLEGLKNGEIDVAIDSRNNCIAFIWYEQNGAFGMHAYLHMIAVKETLRGKGIGKRLLGYFEETIFKSDNMIFLMAADFNADAIRLYKSLGYIDIGIIPGFYRKDINEHLMMKAN